MEKKDIIEDIEIIDDFDSELQETKEEFNVNQEDWLNDFASDSVQTVEDIETIDIIEDEKDSIDTKEKYNFEENTQILDMSDILNELSKNEVNFQSESIPSSDETDNKKSIIFIGALFVILVIVVLALPYLSGLFNK